MMQRQFRRRRVFNFHRQTFGKFEGIRLFVRMKHGNWLILTVLFIAGCNSADKVAQPPPEDVPEEAAPDHGSEPANAQPMNQPESEPRGSEVFEAASEEAEEEEKFSKVDVYFATDRQRVDNTRPDLRYGPTRNMEGDHLEYGKAIVTIPDIHVPGRVERPKWWKFEFREDEKKHVVLREPKLMEEGEFYRSIQASTSSNPADELLMFVHGFNVSWGDAMRRTGQISYDLGFGGVTLCYSWPSQGSLKKYPVDKENSEWTIPHLTKVLMDLQSQTEIGKVHIIAHSMGTRALTYAIANAKDAGIELDLNNIILAAPDIDRDIFKEQILPKIEGHTDLLTMYASSDDEALKISRSFNGSPRLGLSGDSIFVIPQRMDTIDATGIDTSLLGHSYYGSQQVVVKDIFGVIVKGLLPPARSLSQGDYGEWDLPLAPPPQ